MAKYRKKVVEPPVVEAIQWFKNGDHPDDNCRTITPAEGEPFMSEGKVVRYYRNPEVGGGHECAVCGKTMHVHGWIDQGHDGKDVCPGDWVVSDVPGWYLVYPDGWFQEQFDLVDGS